MSWSVCAMSVSNRKVSGSGDVCNFSVQLRLTAVLLRDESSICTQLVRFSCWKVESGQTVVAAKRE